MNSSHVLQNSPVQQMMATGNPSWWNINNLMRPPLLSSHHHQHQQSLLLSPSSSSTTNFLAPPPNNNNNNNHDSDNNNNVFQAQYNMSMATPVSTSSWLDDHPNNHQEQHQQVPESWSQLLLGGVYLGEEAKKMETNWEEQVVLQQQQAHHHPHLVDVKQETSVNSYNNNNNNVYSTTHDQEFQLATAAKAANWSHHHQHPQLNIPVSSPQSCVTSFSSSNNMLDFSSSISSDNLHSRHPPPAPDRSSECNSTSANGGAAKKAKVQASSSTQSTTFKVRKEKLGDRITALHQLVSPFGKTDTASVLLEAIGYIRFLQSQIEALSLPYLNNGAGTKRQPHPIQGEGKCIFPEDPGQLLNDNSLKRKGGPDQDSLEEPKDLRSRGLCLVPVSCTLHVGSDNGADYWAPALGGGFR